MLTTQNYRISDRTRYMFLQDVHSVICLDISESMAHSNAWTEARTFITDYLTGIFISFLTFFKFRDWTGLNEYEYVNVNMAHS